MVFVTMGPLVEGSRLRSEAARFSLYAAGAIAGGATAGAAVASVGTLLPASQAYRWVALAAAWFFVLGEFGVLNVRLPSSSWLVPSAWLDADRRAAGLIRAGFVMGTGFATRAPFASYHFFLLLALLGRDVPLAVLFGVAFGGGRLLTSVILGLAGRRVGAVPRAAGSLMRTTGVLHLATGSGLAVVAANLTLAVAR